MWAGQPKLLSRSSRFFVNFPIDLPVYQKMTEETPEVRSEKGNQERKKRE